MGLLSLMTMVVFAMSSFTNANNKSVDSVNGDYTCKVEIFKPNGDHFVSGKITVWFGGSGSGGYAKYQVDDEGKCTITWDSRRGDYIERITFDESFESGYYEISDIKLVDGKSYKLTAKKK